MSERIEIEDALDELIKRTRTLEAESSDWNGDGPEFVREVKEQRDKIVTHVAALREHIRVAAALAGIASDWDLGQDGKVEIDDEWVSCWSLAKRFIVAARGE